MSVGPRLSRPTAFAATTATWTSRAAIATALACLFIAVQLDWLGLTHSSSSPLAQAAVLSMAALYASTIGALGPAIALVSAVYVLFLDQQTLAVGLQPASTELPEHFWLTSVGRTAMTWSVYAIAVYFLTRRVGLALKGAVTGAVVLVLPFVRQPEATEQILELFADSTQPGFVLLPVYWPLLAALTAMIVTVVLVGPAALRRPFVLVSLTVGLTFLAPLAIETGRDAVLRRAVLLSTSEGAPLSPVTVETLLDDASAEILWDGEPVLLTAELRPLPRRWSGGRVRARLVPAFQSTFAAGEHVVEIRSGSSVRRASYRIRPPQALAIRLIDRAVEIAGEPNSDAVVLALGREGPEVTQARLDGTGTWRSPRHLPAGGFTLVVQSRSGWRSLLVD